MKMKRNCFLSVAVALFVTAPFFLNACQEDAPEINYTLNVSVVNDFSAVVDAINNGALKNEAAIDKLAQAIDKMNADQVGKIEAVVNVLNAIDNTLDTKLMALEAAMLAQTLSQEGKLDLIKAAIEAIPDTSDKIDAVVAAIEALPDYSDKFDAVVVALDAIKTQTEALAGSNEAISGKIAGVTDAINDLIAEVNSGNSDAAQALAAIVAILEKLKEAIANGGDDGETPSVSNSCVIDGTTKNISSAGIDRSDYTVGQYDIYLFLEGGGYINIMTEKEYHDGKTIDLTKKEEKRPVSKWYWAVEYRYADKRRIFTTFAEPESDYVVFQTGTLYMKCLGEEEGKAVFEIRLENGRITDNKHGDGLEHTISLSFKGKMEFNEF